MQRLSASESRLCFVWAFEPYITAFQGKKKMDIDKANEK